MNRSDVTFLALVVTQGVHSIEEYAGRLWDVFPPARFLTGIISENRHAGFLAINIGLFVFGIWCFLWPVRRRWPSGKAVIGGWIILEVVNGIGHPLWSLQQGGYTPGVLTAPILLVLALMLLAWRTPNEIAN